MDLVHAILDKDVPLVKQLLQEGTDIHYVHGYFFRRPLDIACDFGNKEIVRLLIEHGADVNLMHPQGAPTLLWARWRKDIVKMLLDAGADPNQKGSDELTPFDYAMSCGYVDIVRMMLDKGAIPHETKWGMLYRMYGKDAVSRCSWAKRKSLLALRVHFLNQDD
jgi:hypothetical protein